MEAFDGDKYEVGQVSYNVFRFQGCIFLNTVMLQDVTNSFTLQGNGDV